MSVSSSGSYGPVGLPGQVPVPPEVTAGGVEAAIKGVLGALSSLADAWSAHKDALIAARAQVNAQAQADLDYVEGRAPVVSHSSDSDLP